MLINAIHFQLLLLHVEQDWLTGLHSILSVISMRCMA